VAAGGRRVWDREEGRGWGWAFVYLGLIWGGRSRPYGHLYI
jgi:hypothetical protein